MKPSQHIVPLSQLIVLLLAVTRTTAMPSGDASTAAAETRTNSTDSEIFALDDPPTPTAEEIAMLWETLCLRLMGECWLSYKQTKPYLTDEQRQGICFESTKRFTTCDALTAEKAQQETEEAEQRNIERVEAEAEKEQKIARRAAKLLRRRAVMEARLNEMKEAAKDC